MNLCYIHLAKFTPLPGISIIVILLLILILGLVSVLHFYWAFGGKRGLNNSVPHKLDGTPLFIPTSSQCLIVGVGLLFIIGFVYGWKLELFFSEQIYKYGLITLGVIFTLRAIGDFNYVGFFKKIKNTEFGRLDSIFYSPLCLFFGVAFFWLSSTI